LKADGQHTKTHPVNPSASLTSNHSRAKTTDNDGN